MTAFNFLTRELHTKAIKIILTTEETKLKKRLSKLKVKVSPQVLVDFTGANKQVISFYDRESLVVLVGLGAKKDINKGDLFTSDNIGIFRPNIGLQPKEFDKIIGKKSKKNIKKGSPLFNSHF